MSKIKILRQINLTVSLLDNEEAFGGLDKVTPEEILKLALNPFYKIKFEGVIDSKSLLKLYEVIHGFGSKEIMKAGRCGTCGKEISDGSYCSEHAYSPECNWLPKPNEGERVTKAG